MLFEAPHSSDPRDEKSLAKRSDYAYHAACVDEDLLFAERPRAVEIVHRAPAFLFRETCNTRQSLPLVSVLTSSALRR